MTYEGPTGRTDSKLDEVLLELFQLNLSIRELLMRERQGAAAPVINLTSPELDLSPLVGLLDRPVQGADLSGVEAALTALLTRPDNDYGPATLEALGALRKELVDLGVGLRAIASAPLGTGGGGSVFLQHRADNPAHVAVQDEQLDTRFQYGLVAATSVPVYVGTANPGSATTDGVWKIQKYTYVTGPAGDAVPSLVQSATGSWDSRATLFP